MNTCAQFGTSGERFRHLFERNWTFCIQMSYCCSFFSKKHCFSISDHFFKDLTLLAIIGLASITIQMQSEYPVLSPVQQDFCGLRQLHKKVISKLRAKDEKHDNHERRSNSGGSLLLLRLQMCQTSLFCSRHATIADGDAPCWSYNYVTTGQMSLL